MADPLHSNSARNFDQRNELNRASRVAYEPPIEDPIRKGSLNADRELPDPGNEYPDRQLPRGEDARFVRAAEQIGGALGKTVSQARRMPTSARKGIHMVRDRASAAASDAVGQISSSASSLAGNAQQRTRNLSAAANEQARELADRAQRRLQDLLDIAEERGGILLDKAEQLGEQLCERTSALKDQIDDRTRELRTNARLRAEEMRLRSEQMVRERPLHVLGGIAAAAFILGVSLRIVRSRNARGY